MGYNNSITTALVEKYGPPSKEQDWFQLVLPDLVQYVVDCAVLSDLSPGRYFERFKELINKEIDDRYILSKHWD